MTKYIRTVRLTAPVTEPITLSEAKAQLRISDGFTTDDTFINAIISASRAAVEDYCNRYFATANCALLFDTFPIADRPLNLPLPDILSLTELSYVDDDDAIQIIALVNLTLDAERQTITPDGAWPTDAKSVRVEVSAGPPVEFVAPKQSMFLFLTDMYDNRTATIVGTIVADNPAAQMLMQPFAVEMGI